MSVCLPTFFIVRDLEGELFPRLQAGMETGRVSTACGQKLARLFKETLCHRMKG